MDDSRYLECLSADYGDLRDAATAVELTVPVPNCPGWTMSDLVFHVAEVYLHKVTLMRTGEVPPEWPPPGLAAEAPLALLGRTYGELRAEFSAREPRSSTLTWYEPDQTVGFWIRRMAQETVVHRIDAELAAGLPVTPVPADLAVDGASDHPRVVVEGEPDSMLRWLWGRAGDDAVWVTGDPAWAGYLRRMLVSVTR